MTEAELVIVRRAYAKQMLAAFGVTDPRVEAAFAAVRREAYLGPGPWPIWYLFRRGYVATPSDDPVYLYQDVFVGLIPRAQLEQWRAGGPRNADRVRGRAVGRARRAYRRRNRLLHGDPRAYGRRHRAGHGDRIRSRPRHASGSEFRWPAQCVCRAGRWYQDRFRAGRRDLCQRRRDAACGSLARPAQRWRPADPYADPGQEVWARRRVLPHRATRRRVSRQVDFRGRHLPVRGRAGRRVRVLPQREHDHLAASNVSSGA